MMKKIQLTICCGTYCHVMGGSEFPMLNEILSPEIMKHVELKLSTCLGYCKSEAYKPPFVLVDDRLIQEASITKIISELEKLVEGN